MLMPSWLDGLRLLMASASKIARTDLRMHPVYIKGQFIPGQGHLVTNFFASLVSCNIGVLQYLHKHQSHRGGVLRFPTLNLRS